MRVSRLLPAVAGVIWLGGFAVNAGQAPPKSGEAPTYAKDVAPILFKNCTACHRPGEIAPMSLLTYDDVRPHAKAIRDEVSEGHMPPWHAAAPQGTFINERGLTDEERQTLLAWIASGAPEGDLKDLPKAPIYPDGWAMGTPDVVFEMPEDYKVPGEGVIEYEYFYIPTNFTEPKWIQAIEIRPGNREVVHHALAFYKAQPDMKRPPVLQPNREQMVMPPREPHGTKLQRRDQIPSRLLATYAPGTNPQILRPGTAIRLEPGGVIELQMHYTANGEAATDRTKIGLQFAKDPSPREVRVTHFFNGTLVLPAGAPETRVDADISFVADATVWGIFPHTHVRGKRWEYTLELPDGTRKQVLSVPRYDFNWQTYYMFKEPLQVPKGSRLISSAWYDNSAANKSNPDAKVDVKWGDQTWEEMQYTGLLFSPAIPAPQPAPPPVRGGSQ
jgi:mono/diheme cytochrome c family protein